MTWAGITHFWEMGVLALAPLTQSQGVRCQLGTSVTVGATSYLHRVAQTAGATSLEVCVRVVRHYGQEGN